MVRLPLPMVMVGVFGGVVGKRRPRAPNSCRSGSHRLDVFGVGTGKQGRKREIDVAGLAGVKNVAAIIGGRNLLRVFT